MSQKSFKIDSGILHPMNIPTGGIGQPPKYPFFAKMKVGDSVYFDSDCEAIKAAASANNLRRWRAEHKGKKFSKRKLPDGGARIWRMT